ncbi:MAG: HEAT repeat domain-containing protein [Kofleriaceae bacterium]|nr:HEAT repeat domain-containing protein [Kofleriaceae bacterium]
MRTSGTSKLGLLIATLLATNTISQWSVEQDASAQSRRRRPAKGVIAPQLSLDLRGPNTALAETAADTLGKSVLPGAMDVLLDGLAMGLHPRVAVKALAALAANSGFSANTKSYEIVLFYTHHRNAKVRSVAVSTMGMLKDKRAQATVLAALGDQHKSVRAASATILAKQKNRMAIAPMLKLLKKGDDASGAALASLADADLARNIAELIGNAPDGLLARTLGAILMRPDFKPEDARVEVVKAIGKIPGNDSLEQLTNYLGAIPEKPPRQSRSEAEAIVEAKLGG